MKKDGKHISWRNLVKLYEQIGAHSQQKTEKGTCVSQLVLLYEGKPGCAGKIRHHTYLLHILITALYFIQVLSASVANALEYFNDPVTTEIVSLTL